MTANQSAPLPPDARGSADQARPVGPADPPPSHPDQAQPTWRGRQANHPGMDAPEWAAWSWTAGRHDGRRGVSWLGVLLVLLGAALLVNQVNRSIDIGSMFLLALGLAFGAAWLIGGWRSATVPALILSALGVIGLANGVGYVTGPGWTSLALGIALLIAWLIGPLQKVRRSWAMWMGLILTLYGFVRVSPVLFPNLPDTPWLWPLVLIAIGVALLMRRRMDDPQTFRRR